MNEKLASTIFAAMSPNRLLAISKISDNEKRMEALKKFKEDQASYRELTSEMSRKAGV